MFWDKTNLNDKNVSYRGKISFFFLTFVEGGLIRNADKNFPEAEVMARNLAGIKDVGDITEAERNLLVEMVYFGIEGMKTGAGLVKGDERIKTILIANMYAWARETWPQHEATFLLKSNSIANINFQERIINAFLIAYKGASSLPEDELRKRADQFLSEAARGAGVAIIKQAVEDTDQYVDNKANFLGLNKK